MIIPNIAATVTEYLVLSINMNLFHLKKNEAYSYLKGCLWSPTPVLEFAFLPQGHSALASLQLSSTEKDQSVLLLAKKKKKNCVYAFSFKGISSYKNKLVNLFLSLLLCANKMAFSKLILSNFCVIIFFGC